MHAGPPDRAAPARPAPEADFFAYTRAEAATDRAVHCVGIPAALAAIAWLLVRLAPHATARQLAAAGLYGAGLIGMLAASAAYNLIPPGRAKARARRLDHAMIFVMIAGSYTPFALCALPPGLGTGLLVAVWSVAALGLALRLRLGNRYRGAFVMLYLVQGWMVLAVIGPLLRALPTRTWALLVAGGLVYTLGALVHTRERWRFHNTIWHLLVLIAAALHLAAIAAVLGLGA